MSKSLFEKLFEDVMDETDIDSGADAGGEYSDADLGDEGGGDEVTITLDKATARKLYDMLGAVVADEAGDDFGGGLEGEGEMDLGGGEEFGGESPAMGESIELISDPKELHANTQHLQKGKPADITGSTVKGSKTKADTGSIPDVQANPKPLGDKGTSLQKGSQKVHSKLSTPNKSLFDV